MSRVGRARAAAMALAAIAALGCAAAGTILAAGQKTTIRAGNLVIRAEGVIAPKALPRHEAAPISLRASGSVATSDDSHVPPAEFVHLQIDRHLHFDTAGLQSCRAGQLEADTPAQAMRACGGALLGKGKASAEVAFPESIPFSATGTLLAFNGPRVGGYDEQLDYVYVDVPAPTAVIVQAKFAKDSGRFGRRVTLTVPRIAGGAGSLSGFELKFKREWTYKGAQHSYLSAECPSGSFNNEVEANFAGGVELKGSVVSSCTPTGDRKDGLPRLHRASIPSLLPSAVTLPIKFPWSASADQPPPIQPDRESENSLLLLMTS